MKKGLNYIVWFFERLFLLWKIFIIFRNSRAFVLRKLKIDDINSLRMEANTKMKNLSGELPVGTKVMWGINYFKVAMAKKFSFQSRPLSCKNDTPPLTNSTKFIQSRKWNKNFSKTKFCYGNITMCLMFLSWGTKLVLTFNYGNTFSPEIFFCLVL